MLKKDICAQAECSRSLLGYGCLKILIKTLIKQKKSLLVDEVAEKLLIKQSRCHKILLIGINKANLGTKLNRVAFVEDI